MSDQEQIPESEPHLSPGSLLKQAREQADLTVDEVSGKLKLTRRILQSIESDEYATDIPITFYKGYIRNYAELLGLDEQQLVENFVDYCERHSLFQEKEPSLGTVVLEKPIHSSRWLFKTISAILVLVLLYALYYILLEKKVWQQWFEQAEPTQQEESLLPIDPDSATESSSVLSSESASGELQQTVEQPTESVSLAITEPVAAELQVAPTQSNAELVMAFADDCWVKVVDASGKVLALGIKQGGSSINLSGQKPFELTIGKASAVQLTYQNQIVDLSSYPDTRAARLTLGE